MLLPPALLPPGELVVAFGNAQHDAVRVRVYQIPCHTSRFCRAVAPHPTTAHGPLLPRGEGSP